MSIWYLIQTIQRRYGILILALLMPVTPRAVIALVTLAMRQPKEK